MHRTTTPKVKAVGKLAASCSCWAYLEFEIVTDAEYYSPFNLFGKCTTCIASSTDLMEAQLCKGQDGECCENADYGPSMCGELVHGGPKVCRPKCYLTSEVCYSNSDCCDNMCHIDPSKGPGKEGIGFCMLQYMVEHNRTLHRL